MVKVYDFTTRFEIVLDDDSTIDDAIKEYDTKVHVALPVVGTTLYWRSSDGQIGILLQKQS